jgi:hypothetical protein
MQHLILDNEIDISLTGFEVTEIPVHWRVRIQRLATDADLMGQRRTLLPGPPHGFAPIGHAQASGKASMAIIRGSGRVLIQLSSSRRVDPILPSCWILPAASFTQ